ncbi:MAG: hypothetical protein ACOYYU_21090 [Chloroflexota bacterium]
MDTKRYLSWIRSILVFFAMALGLSGLTAIPLQFELGILVSVAGEGTMAGEALPSLGSWISLVHRALTELYRDYAFLAYGYDWMAFGHFVIAIAFLGAARDPLRNKWVIEFGMIACVLILPYAFLLGALRGIPLFWRVIDMLFGVFGVAPLLVAWKMVRKLEARLPSGE